jgi:murein DD-endopeptidase MepM/ murein hydrolase activator NlpD
MKKSFNKTVFYGVAFMLVGCAQTQPAPVVSGYQNGNKVLGVGEESQKNSHFSLTREVSAKAGDGSATVSHAVAQTAPASVKEEDLQSISPAAGPSGKATKAATSIPEKQSLVQDWSKNHEVSQGVVTHTVQPGETVYRLARRYDTTPDAILKANHMDSTADLVVGKNLEIPSGTKVAGAPSDAQVALNRRLGVVPAAQNDAQTVQNDAQLAQNSAPLAQTPKLLPPVSGPTESATPVEAKAEVVKPVAVTAADTTEEKMASIEPAAGPKKPTAAHPAADSVKVTSHTVKKGETVYRIAHEYGASVLDVMSANNFSQPQQLKSGMVVKVPVHEPAKLAESGTSSESGNTSPVAARVVPHEEDETAASNPVPAKTAVDEVKAAFNKGKIDPIAAHSKGLAWPVHGQVIRRFGSQGGGVKQEGINIAVPPNTPVVATDNGTVLYAGSGLKTYGSLVIIRHGNGMFSAYAHNTQLLVSKGEVIKKGQVIALSGATGNVDKPQLYFALRRQAQAIDPMTLLASQ